MIPVTKPYLPSQKKFQKLVNEIWERQWLTNHGPLVNEFEENLRNYVESPYVSFVSNGTIALQIAIKALKLSGEVLTTPFSYVATTSSLVWEGCKPVFVDIDESTFNIDPAKLEANITEKTTAILATHVFGNSCDIAKIAEIAKKYNLKVIYDAAHAFGTSYKRQPIFKYGDISTCSFHATKLLHSTEGGAVFCNNQQLHDEALLLRNFGHTSPTSFGGVGINGKNSEFHAAMGICCFSDKESILERRKHQWLFYQVALSELSNISLLKINADCDYNYSYFPLVFEREDILERVLKVMNANYIYPRRYFYPSLNLLEYLETQNPCPISESLSSRVICLPLYHNLKIEEQDLIISTLKKILL